MSPTSHRPARPLRATAAAFALILSLLLLAACGEDKKGSAAGVQPAALAPADAIAYGEVLVNPSGEVGDGVRAALRRIVRVDDPGAELRRLLDDEPVFGERDGYSRWIEPWLGDTAAAFAVDGGAGRPPEWAVLIATSDRDEAAKMMARSVDDGDLERGGSYEGVEYWLDTRDPLVGAIVDDFFLMGSMEGFRAAVRASEGRSLADEAEFEEALERVPDDRLAWGYVDGRALVTLIEQSGATDDPEIAANLEQLDLDGVGTAVVSLTMRADEVVLEASGEGVDEVVGREVEGGLEIEDLPSDAWLAFAGPLLQSQLREGLDGAGGYDRVLDQVRAFTGLDLERDLFSWLGGLGGFVRGTSPLDMGAGIVAGSRDPAASKRFVGRLERIAGSLGETTPTVGGDGFQLRLPDFPQPLVVLARDDRVAIAIGLGTARDAVDPPQAFGDEEPAKSAIASLGDGYRADFVLTVDPLVSLMTNLGATRDPEVAEVMPYLSAYRSLAIGTKQDDDRTSFKLVLGLQEPDEEQGE